MQLQVSAWEIQEQKGPTCPAKLRCKLLSTPSNGAKCDKPLGSLKPWFAKRGPYTSSVSIAWDLVRNADSQALPHIY